MRKLFALGLLLSAFTIPHSAFAQAPQLINYQGRLLNGTNLVNGSVGLSLRLFNVASGGTKLYEDSNTVTVADGLYSTFIGDNPTNAAFLAALTNASLWIEVAVNGVALLPRERLASVGYSLATRGIAVSVAGNVGIGTATPDSRPLTIKGTGDSGEWISFQNTNGVAKWHLNNKFSGLNFVQTDVADFRLFLSTNGNVGIGTATPASALDVAGTVTASNFVGNGSGLANIAASSLASSLATNLAYLNGTNQTFTGSVNFSSVSNTFTGTFSGNGALVTNVSLAAVTVDQPPVIAWGDNGSGQTTVPAGATGVVAIAGGNAHSLALRGDGTVIAWGRNDEGQTNVPATATGVVAIAGGANHSLALRGDGTVIAWGDNGLGQTNVPAGATGVVAIAGGRIHNLALRGDGTVIAWGWNDYGQTNVPAGATGVVAIAGGGYHSLALRGDGTVIAWGAGTNDLNDGLKEGQCIVPANATGVVAIAGGRYHSLALRGDGTVIAWGWNVNGQTNVPAGATGVVAIAGGGSHSLALRGDGTVIAWGDNGVGQTTVPAGATGVVAIAGGGDHSLALRSARAPAQLAQLNTVNTGTLILPAGGLVVGTTQLVVTAGGSVGIGTATPDSRPLTIKGNGYGGEWISLQNTNGITKWHVNNNNGIGLNFVETDVADFRLFLAPGGNVGIGTGTPTNKLTVAGNVTANGYYQTSDRNAKENIAPLDANAVLEKIMALPVASWNYKDEPTVLHVGPMAQDFHAAFGLGQNNTTIATVDESGVALAAIQALAAADRDQRSEARNQKAEIRSQQEKIEAQEKMILDLRARLDELEKK